jgi:hypothetical protein
VDHAGDDEPERASIIDVGRIGASRRFEPRRQEHEAGAEQNREQRSLRAFETYGRDDPRP